MTRLARSVDVEQRAAHPVVGDFRRPVALIRHVAVGARDARPSMNPLAPELELGMLRLQYLRTGFSVLVVVEPLSVREFPLVPVLLDLFHFESPAPGKLQRHLARAIVLDMALPADK